MTVQTFDQITRAIRQLPRQQKLELWQMLDSELIGRDIEREFDQSLAAIWSANRGVTEDEIMADALLAVREYRATETSRRP
jgi:hypothetical protein